VLWSSTARHLRWSLSSAKMMTSFRQRWRGRRCAEIGHWLPVDARGRGRGYWQVGRDRVRCFQRVLGGGDPTRRCGMMGQTRWQSGRGGGARVPWQFFAGVAPRDGEFGSGSHMSFYDANEDQSMSGRCTRSR
jgi:hypothetical protein